MGGVVFRCEMAGFGVDIKLATVGAVSKNIQGWDAPLPSPMPLVLVAGHVIGRGIEGILFKESRDLVGASVNRCDFLMRHRGRR